MNVTIVVTSGGDFGKRGFYNRQEVGLARGLAALGHQVTVLKSVPSAETPLREPLSEGAVLQDVPTFMLGTNGWFSRKELAKSKPDAVIMFTDLQLAVPSVARWCDAHGLPFVPYVGTVRSNRSGRGALEKISRARNFKAIGHRTVLAKTEEVKRDLSAVGITNVSLMPVGLDTTDLPELDSATRAKARAQFGLGEGPVLGFVGRMEAYKQPLRVPEVLQRLVQKREWQLVVVGDGSLAEPFEVRIASLDLQPRVRWKKSLPNSEMWLAYAATDVLVNLNPGEIWGMSLLESLHFGTPVVAVEAPGPRVILRDGIDGFITEDSVGAIVEKIEAAYEAKEWMGAAGKARAFESFSWHASARIAARALEASPSA